MQDDKKIVGYLPDERPPVWKLILYALQQVIVMFPATVAVAIITGFHISTTIFASGLATLCFILVTGRKIPLYYGSSFSYVTAIGSLMALEELSGYSLDDKIRMAQFGIVMSGFVSIIAGLIVKQFGKESIEKVLPAHITGPIAMVIGLTLAGTAIEDSQSIFRGVDEQGDAVLAAGNNAQSMALVVGLITLIATILFSVYLKGIWGQLPLILGPMVGCLAAFIIYLTADVNLFKIVPAAIQDNGLFALPNITFPKPNMRAVVAIMPIALATIPESTAHIYQLDIYVKDLARKKNSEKKYDLASKLGLNLIGDGIGDIVAGAIGGPAGTNYGENISAMAITRVFSVHVLVVAALISMIIACFTPLISIIYAIPAAVIGGLEIYLFGAIAAQGVAIMVEKKVDMFSAKNIAVMACIMVIGLGGNYGFGGTGNIPFFGLDIPCVATAAIFGILLNLVLSIGDWVKKRKVQETVENA